MLTSANLFQEDQAFEIHQELLKGLLKVQSISKPTLRQELAVLKAFHGQGCSKVWLAEHALRLRKMLSKIVRTARQMKTGERLPEALVTLTNVVKKSVRDSKATQGMRRLLRKRSSNSEDPVNLVVETQPEPMKRQPEPMKRQDILNLYKVTDRAMVVSSESEDCDVESVQIALPSGKTYWDPSKGKVVHCVKADGTLLVATEQRPGGDGFLICDFGAFKDIVTEVPNLKKEIHKRPAVADREMHEEGPQTDSDGEEEEKEEEEKDGEEEEEEEEEKACDEDTPKGDQEKKEAKEKAKPQDKMKAKATPKGKVKKAIAKATLDSNYSVMYYKRDNVCAIRRKWGKKEQCINFGGKANRMTEKDLRVLADEALAKLAKGKKEEEVLEWTRSEAAKRG